MNFLDDLLEPFVGYFRYNESIKYIRKNNPVTIMDIGCGFNIGFYFHALKKGIKFKQYIGVDPLITESISNKYRNSKNIKFIKNPVNKSIPVKANSMDFVIALALLEHVDNPQDIIKESIRILKKGGTAIFTTPTPKAKGLLEFLSFKLGIISRSLMEEHKRYLNKETAFEILAPYQKNIKVTHKYFEFGYNNLILIKKL